MLYFHNPDTNEYRIYDDENNIVVKVISPRKYSLTLWAGSLDTTKWNTKPFQPGPRLRRVLDRKFYDVLANLLAKFE